MEGALEPLSGLGTFVAVVDAGGFFAAASRLGLSKSAVSKQISRLEDRLGARLLNRTTRRLALTEVGRAFYERGVRILAEVEEAERAVTDLHAEPRGTLRVNAPMSFGIGHVAPALPAFMARYPQVSVDLALNDRLVDVIDEGFDVAVRITRLRDSSLIARRLAGFRRVVCASPRYWDQHGRPRHPDELAGHDCLIYTYLSNPGEWPFEGPEGRVNLQVSGRLYANNGNALRKVALEGLGVMMIPTFIIGDDLVAGRLETVLEDWEERDLGIWAVYPHNRHLSAKVRAFVDFLVERFRGLPGWERAR